MKTQSKRRIGGISSLAAAMLIGISLAPYAAHASGEAVHTGFLILDMVHHNIGDEPYDSIYNNPEVLREMGYTGKVYMLFESPTLAITWDSVDKDILPEGSKARKWVLAKAESIRKQHAACEAAGIDIYAMADLILFPKNLIEKYDIEDVFGDPNNPLTRKLIKTMIAEVFEQFPSLDGLVVRIGETYLKDAPYHKGMIIDKTSAERTIIPLINLLRDEICLKRGKTLIFRTWMSFDNNLRKYREISAAVEPHPNLFISVKHVEGDFHRATSFSKVIGAGRHRQIIEVQCAREYEGKGAYPNYVAHGVIEGFEEHEDMPADKIRSIREFAEKHTNLFGGIWTWTRGGGWDGPYPAKELWCDLNAWIMAQWAHDPSRSEASIFERYAQERLRLKAEDVEKFRELCLLSAAAVVRGRNSTHSDMNRWWTRDAGIGWPQYRTENYERNLRQKDVSVEMWGRIVALAESIHWPDDETRTFAVGSAYYGLRLYRIYRVLCYLDFAEQKDDTKGMKKWIEAYDQAWAEYKELQDRPNMSSLYSQEYDRHTRTNADKHVNDLRKRIQ